MRPLAPVVLAAAIVLVSGCRQIAGIEDIQLTGDAGITSDAGTLPKSETLVSVVGEAVNGLIVSSGYVYARTATSVWRCPILGCQAPEILVPSSAATILDIEVFGTELYFASTESGGVIRAVGLDGKNGRIYTAAPDVAKLATDGKVMFWASAPSAGGGDVQRCAAPTCATSTSMITIDFVDFDPEAVELHVFGTDVVAVGESGTTDVRAVKCGVGATCGSTPTTVIADASELTLFPTPSRLLFASYDDIGFYDGAGKRTILANGATGTSPWVAGDDAFVFANLAEGATTAEHAIRVATTGGAASTVAQVAESIDAGAVDGGYLYYAYKTTSVVLARVKP